MFTIPAALALLAKYWHQAAFLIVVLLWAIVLRFRPITLVEALLVGLVILGYFRGTVSGFVDRLIGGGGE